MKNRIQNPGTWKLLACCFWLVMIATPNLSKACICAPPGTVTANAATGVMPGSFQANWNVPTQPCGAITNYSIDLSTSSTFTSSLAGYPASTGSTGTSITLTGLPGGSTYYYRVKGITCGGASAAWSNIIAVTPPVFPSIAVNPANPVFVASDVAYLNKDTAVAVGASGMSWRSTDGGLNWSVISTYTATANNNAVIMLDDYICIAGDVGNVTFSSDKGATWQVASVAQPTVNYHGVHFADTTFGASVGDNGDAIIYHWVGGLGWAHIPSTQTDKFNAVATYKTSSSQFVDGNAIAVGDNGAISTYAFGSWTNLAPPTPKHINGVYLFSDNVTVLAVGQYGLIMRSPDFGNSWSILNNSGNTLRDITDGPNANEFIAVGDSGAIYVSTDGGNTFSQFSAGVNSNLRGVSAKDPRGAFAGSGSTLRVIATDTIQMTYVSDTLLCPGDVFKTAARYMGLFGQNNLASLQLSDSSGSFFIPLAIGTKLNPSAIDSITGTIPSNTKPSVLCKLQIVSSDPAVTSDPNPMTLTVYAKPNSVSVLVSNFTDLYVHVQAGCSYQWYFNNNPINGATDTLVTTIGNGGYYVVVTNSNGCTFTSNTFNYNTTQVMNSSGAGVSISPNPAVNTMVVRVHEGLIGRTFALYDALGKKVLSGITTGARNAIDVSAIEPGVYFYNIATYTGRVIIAR